MLLEVIDEIGHADFCCGPRDADGADEQSHRTLLPGEDMFDEGPDLERLPLAFEARSDIALPLGFLVWICETKPFLASRASFIFDR